ncbi:ShlB/FhaC/HecB family hemolysin secretion/activation protein [Novosphingobium sp. Gsoil 351]|uniref:ShlB/FhaC/HecB family hemolysin secretion/activation protein n=1 Tax=Novosphingobium sp. Gsoil 351 TaxID=2675225 RepID=UPI0012B4441F|nr:ShlB/FhaC/HecB family hemolysin secretion/activation protein [Novosphingobium sp. Gsoil 351]QGN53476.1 ShlB/FhaC/HecB family hemolysin secretion/activation protein [Novosphingobium sp. Gsoil 351]
MGNPRTGHARWAVATAIVSSAMAAVAIPAPAFGQATAGVPTRDELETLNRPRVEEAPQLQIQGGIERSPCPLADPQYKDIPVTISNVTFNNLKGASAGELEAAWKPFAGQPQSIAVLCEIRDAAATILRNKGYLAAVQVPTQKIENGEVKLEVLYARISAVRARGETRGAERKLEQYLGRLTEDEVFNRYKAERYLLLARDLPGYNVQLTLKPAGTGQGDLIGEVAVVRRPYVVDLTVQNYAAKATGRWGAQVRAQVFGLTGLGDATTIGFYSTADLKEQQILQLSHEFRPGSEGLVVGGQFTYAWTEPDLGAASGTKLKARTLFSQVYARYPLRRTQGSNAWLGGGFDYIDQDVDFTGGALKTPLSRDKLRVLWLRADYDAVDLRSIRPRWRAGAAVEFRKGIDVFDASPDCGGVACPGGATAPSRLDGKATATVIRANAVGEFALGRDFSIAVLPRGQYAFDPLLSFEEFTAGNYTIGRGYDPGVILGDSGVGTSAELRGPRLRISEGSDFRVQPYAFGDVAWVWNKGPGGNDRLSSAGGGVRAELGDRFRLDATLAVPLERAGLQTKRGNPLFLLTLTTRILPWRIN